MGGTQFKNNKPQQEAFLTNVRKSGNITESAKNAGVGRDTVYRLINNDDVFREDVSKARLDYLQTMSETMKEHAPEAVEALLSVIRDDSSPKSAKVSAAARILDYSMAWSEALDYESQITELTQELASAKAKGLIVNG